MGNMKLRKALDKANKERQETLDDAPEVMEGLLDAGEDAAEYIAPPKGGVWKAPVYSESLSVRLDSQKLMKNRCICIAADAPELDAFKVLRTQIQQRTREQGMNTIMVTSVRPGEGKTVTAINLALTFAREYHQTVLLVDCDLKKQDIHRYLEFSSDRGLIDYLEYDMPLKDFIIWPGVEKLTLISGGRTVSDSTELLGSPKMKGLLAEMKNRYDDRYVILDVPAVLDGADAMVFAPLVDGIIMVVEKGVTSLGDVKKAVELMPREKFLGFVLNDRTGE
ncbi:MAG: polysaccharide biosynthesis tyrosine autokinase [Desulfurivibrio sp.]|jgi:non-specific protein-tyrosine kinase|nr:MAG: polysaccharide biosynthesis tyrosine autokinase [Desulfurivibrio sp.]